MSWADPDPDEVGQAGPKSTPRWRSLATGLALLMGVGSILLSYQLVTRFSYYVFYYTVENDPWSAFASSWRIRLFRVTEFRSMVDLCERVGMALVLGFLGHRVAKACREPGRPTSLAATAARFSAWGLVGCGLDVAILAGMLIYRWTR